MSQETFFHHESGTVRFWVPVNDALVGAMISKETLHYCYHPHGNGDDALETFSANEGALHDAVRRRVASGSLEPVMLREADLRSIAAAKE